MRKGTLPWSIESRAEKSIDLAYSSRAGKGLSMRSEASESGWRSTTAETILSSASRRRKSDRNTREKKRTAVLSDLDAREGEEAGGASKDERDVGVGALWSRD